MDKQQALKELANRELSKRQLSSFTSYTKEDYEMIAHRGGIKIHKQIIDKLEAVERGDIKRLMIFIRPRIGKSELASIRFPLYCLGKDPKRKIIIGSYGSDLANDFGRKTREIIKSQEYKNVFPKPELSKAKAEGGNWELKQGGGVYTVGVGGALTGKGFDIGIIDDPVKDREQAESETYQKKVIDWYTSTFYTRRQDQDSSIVLMMCMVGNTPVLMENGKEKQLKDVKVGDMIASYDNGKIVSSKVMNWKSQGFDLVFEIKMKSGIMVKANERHPFLVCRNNKLKWIRLKNLKLGDMLVKASTQESINESSVFLNDVLKKQYVNDIVGNTIIKSDGQNDIINQALKKQEKQELSIDMESQPKTTSKWLQTKSEDVPSVVIFQEKMSVLTGEKSSVLTIVTKQEKLDDSCVMTATSQLDMERQKKSYLKHLSTYEIILDEIVNIKECGTEEVFDIQVDRTENFIANGLVVHNTRWNRNDLAGYLLAEEKNGGDKWEVLSIPAIDEEGNAIIWEGKWDKGYIEDEKKNVSAKDWAALYQQDPIASSSNIFKIDDLRYFKISDFELAEGILKKEDLDVILAVDPAFSSSKTSDDAVCLGIAKHKITKQLYLLEGYADTSAPSHTFSAIVSMYDKLSSQGLKPRFISLESVTINRDQTKFIKDFKEYLISNGRSSIRINLYEPKTKKEDRIKFGLEPLVSLNGLHINVNIQDNTLQKRIENQFQDFPFSRKDDIIDCIEQGRFMLNLKREQNIQTQPKNIINRATGKMMNNNRNQINYL